MKSSIIYCLFVTSDVHGEPGTGIRQWNQCLWHGPNAPGLDPSPAPQSHVSNAAAARNSPAADNDSRATQAPQPPMLPVNSQLKHRGLARFKRYRNKFQIDRGGLPIFRARVANMPGPNKTLSSSSIPAIATSSRRDRLQFHKQFVSFDLRKGIRAH